MNRLQLGQSFYFANKTLGVTYDTIVTSYNEEHGTTYTRGWVATLISQYKQYQAQHKVISFPGVDYEDTLPRYDHPPHIYADHATDVVFVYHDVHAPFVHVPFVEAMVQHMQWHRKKGNNVIAVCGGDLQDNSALSRHPKVQSQMLMERQKKATRAFVEALSAVCDKLYFLRGNHDDWFARLLDGALSAQDYYEWLFAPLDMHKLKVIDSTKATIHNCGTDWRVTHSIQYSKIAGRNANILAQKFDMNVITGHEHSLAILRDDFNRHTVIANGMMADFALMSYVNDYDSKHNIMKNSYVVLQDGAFEVMTPYVEWQDWKRYDIDPLPMYEYENQKQQVLTGKLDMMRWIAA